MIPGGFRRRELLEVGDGARRLAAHLMAARAALQVVDPLALIRHARRDAVAFRPGAGKLAGRGQIDERQPVVARIALGGFLRRSGDDCRELDVGLSRLRVHGLAVGEPVAAHPELELRRRQFGQHEPSLIVRHDDLAKLGRKVAALGDHPDAGFRALAARHDAGDEPGVLGGTDLDAPGDQRHGDPRRRRGGQRARAKLPCSPSHVFPLPSRHSPTSSTLPALNRLYRSMFAGKHLLPDRFHSPSTALSARTPQFRAESAPAIPEYS